MVTRDDNWRRVSARVGGWAMLAGMAGALAKALYLMMVSAATGNGAWLVPNLAGAGVDPAYGPDGYFHAGMSLWGLVMHLATGAFWGVVLAAIVAYALPRAIATVQQTAITGLVFGLAVYLVALVIGPALNYLTPEVNQALGAFHPFVGHLIFGLVTAFAWRAMGRRPGMSVMFAPTVTAREHINR